MHEIVGRFAGDSTEELLYSLQGGRLARLVRAVDQVEAFRPARKVERRAAERAERYEVESIDSHNRVNVSWKTRREMGQQGLLGMIYPDCS